MKKTFYIFIFISCYNLVCGQNESKLYRDSIPSKFRFDASIFQFGIGPWSKDTKSNLTEPSSFILSTTKKTFSGFHFDFQAIFRDKLGFETGFDFVGGSLDHKKIRNQFQNHVTDYKTTFAEDNNHTGDSPFSGGYEFRIFKLGVVGFIPYKKVVILPYADYLYSIESDYPSLKVQFTDQANTNSFTRVYKFYNTSCNGLKVGTSIRTYFKNDNKKIKHARLYMQLRTEFVYLKSNGYSYYSDKNANNNEIQSSPINFNQNIYAFIFGFTLGGLDLHW